jgi:Sulfotransferase family
MGNFGIINKLIWKRRALINQKFLNQKKQYIEAIGDEKKILILGNQKTGSTAIADLIAKRSGNSVMLDIKSVLSEPSWLLEQRYGLADFSNFLFQNRSEFNPIILKEPSLTFFYPELVKHFPHARYAFIIRNPLENIRSILNRLKIPGDLGEINMADWPELSYMPTWKLALDSTWLGCPPGNYIEALAYRWNVAAQVYLENNDDMHLIKYEKFLEDKVGEVDAACHYLGLTPTNDISEFLDRQYQSKGKVGIDPALFFGPENYAKIKKICDPIANEFGYSL